MVYVTFWIRRVVPHESGAIEFDVPLLQMAHEALEHVEVENLG